jgi:hypothetical protein
MWVTIALAVLAFVGTLGGAWGGQWIASRHDNRRWEREAKREDSRWEREQLHLREQRARELQLHWPEKRLTAYVECYRLARAWCQLLSGNPPSNVWDRLVHIPPPVSQKHTEADEESLREVSAAFHEHLTTMRIVGSVRAFELAAEIYTVFSGANTLVELAREMASPTLLEGGSISGHLSLIGGLCEIMREDLGIDPPPELAPARSDTAPELSATEA